MANLFAYGTLMCEDIMKSVAGYLPGSQKGVLYDYWRLEVVNEHYPGLVAGEGGVVEGVVYLDISGEGWDRLDSFEGDLYSRQEVEVKLDDGSVLSVYTYVVKEKFTHRLNQSEWSFDRFLEKGKGAFVSFYKGYDEIS